MSDAELLRNRSFLCLLVGHFLSALAPMGQRAGVLIWTYALTSSGTAVSLVGFAEGLALLAVAPVAGVFADRWSRSRTMAGAVLVQALLLPLLLTVRDPSGVPVIIAVTLLVNAASQFFVPAAAAALPGVAGRESVGQANGLLQVATSLVLVVAPGAAAGAFATIGPHGLVVALIGVYLASVPFLALVPASGPAEDQPPKRAVLAELHAGLRYVAGAPRLTGLIAVALLATLGTGALGVLDVVFVTRALHQPPEAAGVLLTATGLGHLAGGVVAALLGRRLAHRYHVLLGAAVSAEGLAVLAYAFTPTLALAAVALFVLGVLFLLAGVSFVTLIQLATDDRYRGRVMSLVNTGMALAVLVSTGAGGALADVFGVRPVIAATAAILSAAGIVSVVAVSGGPGQRGQAGLPVSAAVEPEQC